MDPQTLTNRVEILERKVEELAKLPDRMSALELQVSQLRTEMRVEFSAVRRGDARAQRRSPSGDAAELNEDSRQEMRSS